MSKLYDGNAKITEVCTEELRDYQTKGLTPEEVASSFNLEIKVQPDDASFPELTVETEVSPRECTGKLAGKTQKDVAIQVLSRQGLITSATNEGLLGFKFESAIGKTVRIWQKESQKDDKTYVNTYFSNGAAKLSIAEFQKRLAALTGKAAAKPAAPNDDPFAS